MHALKKFLIDLFTPRLAPILSAIILISIFLCVSQFYLKKLSFMYGNDDYSRASYLANFTQKSKALSVVVLGGSTFRESTYSDKIVSDILSRELHSDIQFLNLASSSQTFLESRAIFDTLKIQRNSLLLIGLTPSRFNESYSDMLKQYNNPRIPFLNYRGIKAFLATNINRFLIWYPDFFSYSLWIKKRFIELSPSACSINFSLSASTKCIVATFRNISDYQLPSMKLHHYYNMSPLSAEQKKNFTKEYAKIMKKKFNTNYLYSSQLLLTLIRDAQKKHVKVILYFLPRSTLARQADSYLFLNLNQELTKIQKITHVPLYNLINSPNLTDEDYYDIYHFLPSGRKKFAPQFYSLVENAWKND
ncbi:MAG: hypothetical protein KIT27_06370 [Legionellales bacterium]|nr:hypothetical protein [Legionellales bacterium]